MSFREKTEIQATVQQNSFHFQLLQFPRNYLIAIFNQEFFLQKNNVIIFQVLSQRTMTL